MSAELSTVTIDAGDVTYDGDLTVGQIRRMSATDGDIGQVIDVLGTIVVSWPFEGDPKNEEAWDDLKLTEFNSVVEGVTAGLGKGQAS